MDAILRQYPTAAIIKVERLGNAGGFSGARLWRAEGPDGVFCLRAWPSGTMRSHIATVHASIEVVAGLPFVPRLVRNSSGTTFVEHERRYWEMAAWMPGEADYWTRPSSGRLKSACQALALLHIVWEKHEPRRGPCPALARRWSAWRDWREVWERGWRPQPARDDPISPWVDQAVALLPKLIGEVPALLGPWEKRETPLHLCLGDIWHDHVLFTGEQVTGMVDYGSVKWDHAAVDLARLLGSLVGDDPGAQARGIAAYQAVRPFSAEEENLVAVLDRTGTILGAANWLRWLCHEDREYENREAVARRLATLVRRLQGCGERET